MKQGIRSQCFSFELLIELEYFHTEHECSAQLFRIFELRTSTHQPVMTVVMTVDMPGTDCGTVSAIPCPHGFVGRRWTQNFWSVLSKHFCLIVFFSFFSKLFLMWRCFMNIRCAKAFNIVVLFSVCWALKNFQSVFSHWFFKKKKTLVKLIGITLCVVPSSLNSVLFQRNWISGLHVPPFFFFLPCRVWHAVCRSLQMSFGSNSLSSSTAPLLLLASDKRETGVVAAVERT